MSARSLLLEVPDECEQGHYSWRCQVSVSEAPGSECECEVITPGGAR